MMDTLIKRSQTFRQDVDEALLKIGYVEKHDELESLKRDMARPDFWQDPKKAADIAKKQAELESRLSPWRALKQGIDDVIELLEMGDASIEAEVMTQLEGLEDTFTALKKELRYSGPYDHRSAIISIYAGAGGTDAQDWAAMLLRMYVRWCEKQKFKFTTIEESAGEEAGIKTVTLEIDGPLAYGKLKHEHGVHRLVRLSPFNADSLRQTSFAKVEVLPKIDEPDAVEIDEKELKIDVYRSGGKGGQSVNTTDSAVRITHMPTGLVVAIQNERSQLQNRETAMTILRSRLAQLQIEQHAKALSELKGPNQSAEWGNQIRSYVLHPYKMVKDLRTNVETSDTEAVLDGDIDIFIDSF